jgi:L-alanine-DL-glutamate epimerase-like enolase superfamily enzyme
MAAEAGRAALPCVPHSANVSMVSIFTLHMLAAIPNPGRHMEFSIESQTAAAELYSPALKVRDGQVAIPPGPGWGVTINARWLEQADHQLSRPG